MRKIAGALLAVVLFGAPVSGQETEEIQFSKENVQAERRSIIRNNVQLTETEARAFWPLYEKYRAELNEVDNQRVRLIREFAESYQALSDEKALELLSEFFKFKEAKIELQTAYIAKFSAFLPGKKVMRYYQVEHLIDTRLDYDLTRAIPLVK